MSKMSEILSALHILQNTPMNEIESSIKDGNLIKAAADLSAAQSLKPGEVVGDHWLEGNMNKGAQREEIKTGPSEASSGGGAERMVRDYSMPAPQNGTTLTAESLARIMEPVAAASKAQTEAIGSLIEHSKSVAAILSGLVKSEQEEDDEEEEDEEEEDEEESEVVEINAAKARTLISKSPVANKLLVKSFLAKARVLIAKAAKTRDKAKDMKTAEERKACRKSAKELDKRAALFLGKALAIARLSKELSKAHFETDILTLAAKADINVVQEEEEDEEEEDEEEEEEGDAKSKAKKPAKGNQAAKQDPATGNQDDSAAKAIEAMGKKIDDALSGFGLLKTDVQGMMSTIMGQSRGTGVVPEISKSVAGDTIAQVTPQRIEELCDAGQLLDADRLAALDIISKAGAAAAGLIDKKIVTDRIAKSSTAVQMLFGRAAA
jgi:hypothetical protein